MLSIPGDRLGCAGKTTQDIVQMWNEAHPEPEGQPFQASGFAGSK